MACMESALNTYTALLQGYTSRDKILRTVGYVSVFASGSLKGKLAQNLQVVAKRLSETRTVMRLFDDIPMWTITRTWGANEKDYICRICTALGNLSLQLYFPFEKIAWACDQNILPFKLNSGPLWNAAIGFWAIYLVFAIIRNLRQFVLLSAQTARLAKQKKLESPERSGEKGDDFRKKLREIKAAKAKEVIILIKNLGDITMAINWLPLGVLWSGKLSPSRNAFFGMVSSLTGLYLVLQSHYESKKNK